MEKITKRLLAKGVWLLIFCTVVGYLMDLTTKPKMGKGRDVSFNQYSEFDSTMIEGRHYGYINIDKFLKLASYAKNVFDINKDVSYSNDSDSIFVKVNEKSMFYNYNKGTGWREKYKNNSVVLITDTDFRAKIKIIDSVKYLYMPFQILISVASYVNKHPSSETPIIGDDTVPRQTLRKNDIDKIKEHALASTGKIQTGGYVFNNLADILKDYTDIQGDRHKQLKVVWQYVYDNWNYINDPYDTKDTWRSATETIENYYFVSGKKYSGDCDDFAILMASFARQLGYRSRIVTAFNSKGEGHAYAEYYRNKHWYSMDWFGCMDGEPFEGKVDGIYENL